MRSGLDMVVLKGTSGRIAKRAICLDMVRRESGCWTRGWRGRLQRDAHATNLLQVLLMQNKMKRNGHSYGIPWKNTNFCPFCYSAFES